MDARFRTEGRSVPPVVAPHELQAGRLRQGVELGWAGVPEVPRPQPDAAFGDVDVLSRDRLRRLVVLAHREHHLVHREVPRGDRAAGAVVGPRRARTPRGRRARSGARRSATRARHRRWASTDPRLKKVLNAANTTANGGGSARSRSAMSPRVTTMSSPPGLARRRSSIAGDASMPCTSTPRAAQRQRQPAGPDPELEHGTPAGLLHQRGQPGGARVDVGDVAVPVVVHVGEAVPVAARLVALHQPSVAGRAPTPTPGPVELHPWSGPPPTSPPLTARRRPRGRRGRRRRPSPPPPRPPAARADDGVRHPRRRVRDPEARPRHGDRPHGGVRRARPGAGRVAQPGRRGRRRRRAPRAVRHLVPARPTPAAPAAAAAVVLLVGPDAGARLRGRRAGAPGVGLARRPRPVAGRAPAQHPARAPGRCWPPACSCTSSRRWP